MIDRQKLVDENNQQLQQAIDVIEKLTECPLNNSTVLVPPVILPS